MEVVGSRWNPAVLFLLCFGFLPSVATCPSHCLCASDIISCCGNWISQPFDRLATLVLSKNSISRIDVNAFNVTPHLLHLDLSSNQLTVLNSSVFAGLRELKELLLFDNQIVQINPGTFSDLHSLQKLYLSTNRLTAFPLGLYEEPGGPRNLTFLDLSNNRLSEVPIQSLLLLTRHGGIYLQGNPLVCDCALLALLEYWLWKQYRPLVDFRTEYACREGARPELNCKQQGVADMPLEGLVVFWVTPQIALNSSASDLSGHLTVLPNGTLEIQGALLEDSGTYGCVVARGHHFNPSEPLEVSVFLHEKQTLCFYLNLLCVARTTDVFSLVGQMRLTDF
uniref:Ig-like domain-containing protein n=1 Tax=Stegastes partitus TaxID=144197 RepID=A0A3B4ZKG8_9TELE